MPKRTRGDLETPSRIILVPRQTWLLQELDCVYAEMAEEERKRKNEDLKRKRTGGATPGQGSQDAFRSVSEAARFAMRFREIRNALFDAKEGEN